MTFYFSLRHVGELTDEKLLVVHGMKDAQVDVVQSCVARLGKVVCAG